MFFCSTGTAPDFDLGDTAATRTAAGAWPGDLYLEGTNAEPHFDLLHEVLRGCRA